MDLFFTFLIYLPRLTMRPEYLSFRASVWGAHYDYPLATGHGIGSFLSIKECNRIKLNFP